MNPSTMIVPMSAPASTEVSNAAGCASDLAQQLYPTIAQQPFFKGLNVHQLQLLADSAMGVDFRADELIFSEGAPANQGSLGIGCEGTRRRSNLHTRTGR
jgi:hypothetical protein